MKTRAIPAMAALLAIAVCLTAWQKTNVAKPDAQARQIYVTLDPYAPADGSQFWVRVTEHPEANASAFVAGSFYFFDSGPAETGPWRNILSVHLDDPDPIPTNNVRFVNAKIAYVFLYDKLAVTTDGGMLWSSWELAQGNPEWRPKRAIIRDIILSADGTGTMKIEVFASRAKITLRSNDFGKSWEQQ